MPEKERLIRISFLARRNESMTEDEFNQYWTQKHAPLVSDWLAKYGVIKYTQYHTTSALRQRITSMKHGNLKTATLDTHDGTAEFLIRESDFELFGKAREDPYYLDVVQKDEAKFFDMDKSIVTAGWEEVYVEDGEVVNIADVGKQQEGKGAAVVGVPTKEGAAIAGLLGGSSGQWW